VAGIVTKNLYVGLMLAGIALATPIALYVRFVDNPGLGVMALACLGATLIFFALYAWRRNTGYGISLAGVVLNGLVILANGGRMPVVSYHSDYYGTLWQPATSQTHYVFLADQPFFGYASFGDIVIVVGVVVVVASALYGRLRGERPLVRPLLQG